MSTRASIDDIWHALDQYYKVAPRTAARAQYALEQLLIENARLKRSETPDVSDEATQSPMDSGV